MTGGRLGRDGFVRRYTPVGLAPLGISTFRAAGKTVEEAEVIPLVFTLIPVLALLSNYDRGNSLINVGTEGKRHSTDELRENRREGRAAAFIKRTKQRKAAGLPPEGKVQPRPNRAKRQRD